jgi:hypothetical protein
MCVFVCVCASVRIYIYIYIYIVWGCACAFVTGPASSLRRRWFGSLPALQKQLFVQAWAKLNCVKQKANYDLSVCNFLWKNNSGKLAGANYHLSKHKHLQIL